MTGPGAAAARRADELAATLRAVRERVASACVAAGRDPSEVTLVAVAKTFPASDIRHLAGLGVCDVGENRDQEARAKAAELADLELVWHYVGQLQRNKCRSVAGYATVVHSVDRPGLAAELAAAAHHTGRQITVLVQVSLDGDPRRGGAPPADVPRLADTVAASGLQLGGVMAVPPLGVDPSTAYARLARIAAGIRSAHPQARIISAGMSGDLEAAIGQGATLVRVGTALFGLRRPMLR